MANKKITAHICFIWSLQNAFQAMQQLLHILDIFHFNLTWELLRKLKITGVRKGRYHALFKSYNMLRDFKIIFFGLETVEGSQSSKFIIDYVVIFSS